MLKMKQIKAFLTLSVLAIAMLSCKKDEISSPEKGSVKFSFNLSTQVKSVKVDASITPSAVVISAEDMNGKQVYKNEQVSVELINGNYSTKPLEFEAGNYRLTKFMVVDANGIVLTATPMGYASAGVLVDTPLPIKFSVQLGYVTSLSPEILSTQNKNPQAFGYSTFDLNQQPSYSFRLGVYVYNSTSKKFEITDASISIATGTGETIIQNLPANVDSINLKEADKYIVTVSKDGYQAWIDTLASNDLLRYYTSPFAVTLDKTDESSFSFVTKQDTLRRVAVTVKNSDSSTPMRINWGDGQIEISAANNRLMHDYKAPGTFKVKISGNISSITKLTLANCQLTSINVEKASSLSSIDVSRNTWLKTLNLSSKPRLKEVLCVEGSLENLNLSNSDSIELVQCSLNSLTNLNISTLPRLKSLYCDRNKISALDSKNNPNLQVLYCYQNNLTALDITNNSGLETLDCRNNQLASLDVTKSNSLKNLQLGNSIVNNDNANKVLVDLSNNVKLYPRFGGQVSVAVSVKSDGQSAKSNLENAYQWTVSIK